ncbi:MAG TPA: hypothetical protein ENJ08_10475 [Gammaproteobacteria bacterium]|nr:hypothetical protein [Gammaproteobacteria bacterium]
MYILKTRKKLLLSVLCASIALLWAPVGFSEVAAPPATPPSTATDSDKLDKMLKLMESLNNRIEKLEAKDAIAAKGEKKTAGKSESKPKAAPTKKVASGKSYQPGWIVKVYKNEVKGTDSTLGNRVGAFIAKSLPINAKDHEKKSKVAGETGYKISGYLKISHSAETTIGMRLFSKIAQFRNTASCYKASLSLEGTKIITATTVRPGGEGAPNILTGVVNLQPGNYKVDIEYTCTGGSYNTQNYFDITYLTDDMLNAKVVSKDMMLRKAAKK